jgi:subtilisin-like proprotein convertase family protein
MRVKAHGGGFFFVFVAFALAVCNSHAGTVVFSNTNYLTINDSDNPPTLATPYPSIISVSNLTGQVITNLTVTFNGLSHEFPSDIDMILVGPQGQWTYLMAEVGGIDEQFPVTNLTITLADGADPLPILDGLSSGTWRPGLNPDYQPFEFPAPAPSVGTNLTAALSVFQNTDPDGIWSLYVVDDSAGDAGSISGGWSLSISTGVPLQVTQSGTNAVFSWPNVPGQVFSLQFSPVLADSNSWTNVGTMPVLNAGRYAVTNQAKGYYRLIGQ